MKTDKIRNKATVSRIRKGAELAELPSSVVDSMRCSQPDEKTMAIELRKTYYVPRHVFGMMGHLHAPTL